MQLRISLFILYYIILYYIILYYIILYYIILYYIILYMYIIIFNRKTAFLHKENLYVLSTKVLLELIKYMKLTLKIEFLFIQKFAVNSTFLFMLCFISSKEPCSLISPEELNCLAPNVTGVTGYINDTQVTVQLGFAMQNVKSVQVIRNISVRGDPVFYKFDGIMDLQQNNLYLKVRGESVLFTF